MTIYLFTVCNNGNLRLVGGRHPAEGRLEFCFGGMWGTVCHDRFGTEDAQVACHQLGFTIGECMHNALNNIIIIKHVIIIIILLCDLLLILVF